MEKHCENTKLVNSEKLKYLRLYLCPSSFVWALALQNGSRQMHAERVTLSITIYTSHGNTDPHRVLLFSRSYLVRATVVGTQLKPPNKPLSLAISTHHNLREHVEVFFDDNLFLWRASLLLLLLALAHPARCRRDACLVLPTEEHNLRGQVVT